MNNYFENISQRELANMFRESEETINKTGQFSENGTLYEHYQKWSKNQRQPMPMIFLMELYHALCKSFTMI